MSDFVPDLSLPYWDKAGTNWLWFSLQKNFFKSPSRIWHDTHRREKKRTVTLKRCYLHFVTGFGFRWWRATGTVTTCFSLLDQKGMCASQISQWQTPGTGRCRLPLPALRFLRHWSPWCHVFSWKGFPISSIVLHSNFTCLWKVAGPHSFARGDGNLVLYSAFYPLTFRGNWIHSWSVKCLTQRECNAITGMYFRSNQSPHRDLWQFCCSVNVPGQWGNTISLLHNKISVSELNSYWWILLIKEFHVTKMEWEPPCIVCVILRKKRNTEQVLRKLLCTARRFLHAMTSRISDSWAETSG